MAQQERFHRTLVGADLHHLHIHTHLVEQFLVVGHGAAHTAPVNDALWIDNHRIGCRTQIIGSLGVLVTVGNNELSLLLEVEQCLADALQGGRHGTGKSTCLQIDALHFGVGLCMFNGFENVIQSLVCQHGIAENLAKGILFATLVDASLQLDDQHAVVFHTCQAVAH